ncbi:unnamed protein product [Calypogeia fissa]
MPRGCNAIFDEAQEIFSQRVWHVDLNEASPTSPPSSARHQFVNPIFDEVWEMVPGSHSKANGSMDRSVDQLSVMSTDSYNTVVDLSVPKQQKSRRRAVYDLRIHNLSYEVNVGGKLKEVARKKVLLNNVNAKANHSEVLAIIGRSGSSKTTLLDALAGRIDHRSLEGSILVNGKRMDDGLKSISGYVMQEDALFPMLTVKEILMFSAQLRVPNNVTKEQKAERVKALIEELGLSACCDTRVGDEKVRGISGGERRRLSIGVDVIHDPPILLLDEPTSGLDSTSALQVMESLCRLAVRRRHTVVLTVHQPSYRMLGAIHNMLVLAKGSVVYHGHSSGIVDHFATLQGRPMPEHVNVVEYALDTIAEFENYHEGLNKLIAHEKERRRILGLVDDAEIPKEVDEASFSQPKRRRSKYATSFLSEFTVLSKRNFYNIFRTHTLFLTRVGVTVLTGLVLVTIFYLSPISQKGLLNRQVYLIFTLAILVFTSTEALPIFLLERQIFIRETSRGAYRTSSYVLSHALVGQPFFLFLAALCTGLSYFAVGLASKTGAIFFFTLVIFLVLSMSNALVTMVSALFPNFTVALAVVGGSTAYMFLFSGFFINRMEIPWYWLWLHYLSLFKYSYESLLANELESLKGAIWYNGMDSAKVLHQLVGGRVNQMMNILVMAAFVVAYRIIFYIALLFGTNNIRR